MTTIFSILINPVTVSVLVLCALCLTGLNVLLSMLIACIIGGVAGGIPLLSAPEGTQTVMQLLTSGFASNATTALAYILLGTFATCISTTGLAEILSKKLSRLLGGHRLALIGVLTLVACLSQNLIPVHIAYIPILVPPLLGMMNRMKLDRRAVACALAFGHKVPYITIPFGFGLIFQRVIADNLTENGLSVTVRDVTAANWSIGIAMLLGLLAAVFVLYRRPREYYDLEADTSASEEISEKLEYRHYVMLGAAIVVAVVQVISQDLALSALCGLVVIVVFRAIKWNEIDAQVEGGIRLMGQIAIIMLVAGGVPFSRPKGAVSCRILPSAKQAGQALRRAPHKIPRKSPAPPDFYSTARAAAARPRPLCGREGGIVSGSGETGNVSRGDSVPLGYKQEKIAAEAAIFFLRFT